MHIKGEISSEGQVNPPFFFFRFFTRDKLAVCPIRTSVERTAKSVTPGPARLLERIGFVGGPLIEYLDDEWMA